MEPGTWAKFISALAQVHDSLSGWSIVPSEVEFVPPPFVPQLMERVGRIVELLGTERVNAFARDVQKHFRQSCMRIVRAIEEADEARSNYLHPRATGERRNACMYVINTALEDAYQRAKGLARDMEGDYIAARSALLRKADQPGDICLRALARVRRTLSDPQAWCKEAEAKTARGFPIVWGSARAVSFSVVGAARAATQHLSEDLQHNVLRFIGYASTSRSAHALQVWNDKVSTRHEELLDVLDRATLLLEKHGLSWQYELNFWEEPEQQDQHPE